MEWPGLHTDVEIVLDTTQLSLTVSCGRCGCRSTTHDLSDVALGHLVGAFLVVHETCRPTVLARSSDSA